MLVSSPSLKKCLLSACYELGTPKPWDSSEQGRQWPTSHVADIQQTETGNKQTIPNRLGDNRKIRSNIKQGKRTSNSYKCYLNEESKDCSQAGVLNM
jgi:hypothetical protein